MSMPTKTWVRTCDRMEQSGVGVIVCFIAEVVCGVVQDKVQEVVNKVCFIHACPMYVNILLYRE